MEQDEIERTILRQRELVERSVEHAHVAHAGLFQSIVQFLARRGIGRIDNAFGSDHLRQDRRVVAACGEMSATFWPRFTP